MRRLKVQTAVFDLGRTDPPSSLVGHPSSVRTHYNPIVEKILLALCVPVATLFSGNLGCFMLGSFAWFFFILHVGVTHRSWGVAIARHGEPQTMSEEGVLAMSMFQEGA